MWGWILLHMVTVRCSFLQWTIELQFCLCNMLVCCLGIRYYVSPLWTHAHTCLCVFVCSLWTTGKRYLIRIQPISRRSAPDLSSIQYYECIISLCVCVFLMPVLVCTQHLCVCHQQFARWCVRLWWRGFACGCVCLFFMRQRETTNNTVLTKIQRCAFVKAAPHSLSLAAVPLFI